MGINIHRRTDLTFIPAPHKGHLVICCLARRSSGYQREQGLAKNSSQLHYPLRSNGDTDRHESKWLDPAVDTLRPLRRACLTICYDIRKAVKNHVVAFAD